MGDYIGMMRKTLWSVNEKDFEGLLAEGLGFSLKYFAILVFTGSILTFLLALFRSGFDVPAALVGTVFVMLSYAAGIGILLPLISHILIGALGGKRPMSDTFQMYFYSSTPSMLLGWVPVVGSFSPLVSFGNVFRGLREINGFPFWKAFVAVLLPSLAYWGVWMLLVVGLASLA